MNVENEPLLALYPAFFPINKELAAP